MKKWWLIPVIALLVVVVAGLARLQINADVFSLLPVDSTTVEGLRLYQKSFGSSQAIIVSVRSADKQSTTQAAETLAQNLREAALADEVIWRSPFQNDPQAMAEFLAYLWFNQAPESFQAMTQRFDDDALQLQLERTIERMSASFNPQEIARLAHDPFSLSAIGNTVSNSVIDVGKNPFASDDGRLRILYVPFPGDKPGFLKYRQWLGDINQLISDWQQHDPDAKPLTVRITGNPVFVTEFGSRMMRDMLFAAMGTLCAIALLFWWAHRRWLPLLSLVSLLMVTVVITVALGGFLFGTLNAISLGFAAILMGLAVDYGLILYQERRTHPERSTSTLRRMMAPSILWAAVTTAGAFAMVSRSSLPGLTQLGFLVAIGIVTAAVLMLIFYVAVIGRTTPENSRVQNATRQRVSSLYSNDSAKTRVAWSATLVLLTLAALMLLNREPGIEYGVDAVKFENVQARSTLEEIQRDITGYGSELWLIVRGANEQEVGAKLANAEAVLARAKQNGMLTRNALPSSLWPVAQAQQDNRQAALALAERLDTVQQVATATGFAPESLTLTRGVFENWQRFAEADTVAWPTQAASRWLFSQFAANDNGEVLALGQVEVADTVSSTQLQALADELANQNGGQLVGWSLLANSLVDAMKQDVIRVVLPMALALVLLLGFAYRDPREIALSFATLGFMLVCLIAIMSALGWSWNLMNMTALPLLLGAAVDYSIHMQLALKRYAGDLAQVKRSVGNAILLCGASTAAAFASLGFASNPGLASLGKVAALGIVIASLTAVFLLPLWWTTVQRRKLSKEVGELQ